MNDYVASVMELIKELFLLHPNICRLEFLTIEGSPPAFGYDGSSSYVHAGRLKRSGIISRRTRIPFLEVALTGALLRGESISQLLPHVMHHNRMVSAGFLNAGEDHQHGLYDMLKVTEDGMLAVSSRALCRNGDLAHIPMLDFRCDVSDRNLDVIRESVAGMQLRGSIINSGRSYHFYGDRLMTQTDLGAFLGRALLFSPIVDSAWIAHQLIEGRCALRVSKKGRLGRPPILLGRI